MPSQAILLQLFCRPSPPGICLTAQPDTPDFLWREFGEIDIEQASVSERLFEHITYDFSCPESGGFEVCVETEVEQRKTDTSYTFQSCFHGSGERARVKDIDTGITSVIDTRYTERYGTILQNYVLG